jgi:L-threonine-O-3-phosphate decarboxylase
LKRPVHGGNLVWAAQVASCPPSAILDFSASINPLGLPQSAIAAIQAGIPALVAYPDPTYTQLRSTLAARHNLDPEWILPGNGAAELLTWAGWELAQQAITYLPTPAFRDYWRALSAFGAKVQRVLLGASTHTFSPPVTDLPPIPPGNKQAGLLINNPHNPTGTLFSVEAILPYLETYGLVVVDEAFMDFLPPWQQQSLLPYASHYANLIVVRSLTKFYSLPGLRFGYVVTHPERIGRWQQLRDPWAVNHLADVVAQAVIQDEDFAQRTLGWLIPARDQLFEGLAALPGLQPLPSTANFLLVGTEQPSTALQLQLLKQKQILIRDCVSFPKLGEGYFRVAVRTQTDNQRLLDGLTSSL